MAPSVKDAVYTISSGEYAANLLDGEICGCPINTGNWRIRNIGPGGNQVTIESVCAPGTFVTAEQFQGASLVGAGNPLLWTLVKVDSGKYYLQSPDGDYVWQFPSSGSCENIVLVHHTGQENTKVSFERVLYDRARHH